MTNQSFFPFFLICISLCDILQGSTGQRSYGLSSIISIAKNEGIRGLYRGYSVTAFCNPMFHAMYFPIYECFKDFYRDTIGLQEGSFALYAFAASSGGVISNCITNPFWMVRTRMQAEIFHSMSQENYSRKYPMNLFKTMRII